MSDPEESPPTLAKLRSRSSRSSAARASEPPALAGASQLGLLFGEVPEKSKKAAKLPVERRIWSVRDLVGDVRQQVESGYDDVWVEGEVSNTRLAPSGHLYFTLKDGEAQLPVVVFRRQAILLRFRPPQNELDGLAVLVKGRISIYESRGQLQLIGETLEPRGVGALQVAFEQLKARLLAEGLFDAARKRPLPGFPRCVGVITSPGGAVVRDIITVVRRRHSRLNLLIYPAAMQGANCCSSVAAGIRWFNAHPERADVIILARGGGSLEDLAGFNEEALARAIAASRLPVVSAIGHETDFTIADLVADLRAPTPSAAAELVTAAQHRIGERVELLGQRLERAVRFRLLHARQRVARLSADSLLLRLRDSVGRRGQRLDELQLRLNGAVARRLRVRSQRLEAVTARLRQQNVALRAARARHRLQGATARLRSLSSQSTAGLRQRLNRASTRLEALSPLAVLGRGYALAYSADGRLLRSAAETAPDEVVRVRLGSGSFEAEVKKVEPQ
jgi:exodeoxyribonuclease VII large subunit